MNTASEAFSAGLYNNTVIGVVWDGKLRVGIRSFDGTDESRWSIWDNFLLTYLGLEEEAKGNILAAVAAIYNMNGQRVESMQRGVNIVRMSDGTTRKVFVK